MTHPSEKQTNTTWTVKPCKKNSGWHIVGCKHLNWGQMVRLKSKLHKIYK